MRKINAWLYVTLDSVIEAPEKWAIAADDMFGAMEADYAKSDALLLGRRTYETFAASWPERGSEVPNADWMNNTRKYVASTTLDPVELKLIDSHAYDNGVVSLTYKPTDASDTTTNVREA